MPLRLVIEAPGITPSEPTPAIAPTEPVQLAPLEVVIGAERNAQTVTESNIKPQEIDIETTGHVLETEEPVYDPDRGSEEVRRGGRSRRATQLYGDPMPNENI